MPGHLKLKKLRWIYDSDRVSIEGHTEFAFTEEGRDTVSRFRLELLYLRDANDKPEVLDAFDLAARERRRPTLIIVESDIGTAGRTSRTAPAVVTW